MKAVKKIARKLVNMRLPDGRHRCECDALQAEIVELVAAKTALVAQQYADAAAWERMRCTWRKQRIETERTLRLLNSEIVELRTTIDTLRAALVESDVLLAATTSELSRTATFNDELMHALAYGGIANPHSTDSTNLDTRDRIA